jgi:hypothetical protein
MIFEELGIFHIKTGIINFGANIVNGRKASCILKYLKGIESR